ncbi:MAG: acyl-CoA dehydrogenase [Syntrophales bacterium]|jgi:acyl-CoA dehydrogenase|nr:acyl-CoA dehydrogenase [Syntrophales bacterium]MCK9527116.1 acyl-CoA dehydrogenase [Syntrophales bacterium]MDX9921759.1 acyl-CoA dehydrogenase [Syntrophales bacterium]
MILLNPTKHRRRYPDEPSRDIMLKTIEFFETKGKTKLKEDDRDRVWYDDFLEFIKKEKIFARLLTPSKYGPDESYRWDTWRNCEFNEITAFYGLHYWYTWQVSILGLGPIWMSDNEEVKKRAAELLEEGAIFAFGLSERDHGADIYSTEMTLTPQPDGTWLANGEKYYIGNGNKAEMVSTFGRTSDTGDYVFFISNFRHKQYELRKNIVNVQSYVADFKLTNYPVTEADILKKGPGAWDDMLNTVNVGKYNLGWASIGICTHAFYEAINHASNRKLYGMYVTDMPHVKQMFTDAYVRLVGMKLFGLRCADYMRTAHAGDRRYLLYDPTMKMKVTTQGEQVIDLLWDVIAAKGFEMDTYFEMATRDIRALPKLEGTVHVNIMLIVKFIKNYLFDHHEFEPVGTIDDMKSDDFFWNQGPAKNLGSVRFHDYSKAYDAFDLPNISIFRKQIDLFKEMLITAMPDESQMRNPDFMLTLGEMFTLIVYGQLILENAPLYGIDKDIIDQMFDCYVRDFSSFALEMHNKPSVTQQQMHHCLKLIGKPVVDEARYDRVWNGYVIALKNAYEMNP